MNKLHSDKEASILRLLEKGVSIRAIATIVQCNKNTVQRIAGKKYVAPKQTAGSGLCECGCGGRTTLLANDDNARGLKAGDYSRFIFGHWHDLKRTVNPNYGAGFKRIKQREIIRAKLVEAAISGPVTIWDLKRSIAPQLRPEGISRMLNYARDMSAFGLYPVVPNIIVRTKLQIRPQYERPEIPNEQETEIPLLVKKRFMLALDGTPFESSESYHSFLNTGVASPLDLLIEKEELPEKLQHAHEAERFETWLRANATWKHLVENTSPNRDSYLNTWRLRRQLIAG